MDLSASTKVLNLNILKKFIFGKHLKIVPVL